MTTVTVEHVRSHSSARTPIPRVKVMATDIARPVRDRAALALDLVVAGSLILAAVRVLELIVLPGMVVRTVLYVTVLVAVAWLWTRWRRAARAVRADGRRLAAYAVIFTVLTASLFFIGDEPSGLPLFVVGLIMLQRVWGLRGGVIAVTGLLVAIAVFWLAGGRGWLETGQELLTSIWLFGFSLLIAWLFAEIDRQRRDTAALAAEVQRRAGMEAELASTRERQRSARDLHDGIGHQVTVIMMSLQFAERMRERDPDRAWSEVSRAREQAAAALGDIRKLARALHPSGLAAVGAADLSALAASFAGTELAVTVADEAAGLVLPDDLAVFRQRFVQESLTNVVRHSSATAVTVVQRVDDQQLVLAVIDNGDPATEVDPGFGLRSLTERAAELGGSAAAEASQAGWAVSARVPISEGTRR